MRHTPRRRCNIARWIGRIFDEEVCRAKPAGRGVIDPPHNSDSTNLYFLSSFPNITSTAFSSC